MEETELEERRGGKVDWMIKGRLLIMGFILLVIGLVLYFFKGPATLVLVAIGAILLIVGVLYKPRKKPEPPTEETD